MKRISTFDLLLKQHGKVLIPLSELCEEYLGVTYRVARRHYLSGSLLIPVVAMSCARFVAEAMAFITENPGVPVVIASRWALNLELF